MATYKATLTVEPEADIIAYPHSSDVIYTTANIAGVADITWTAESAENTSVIAHKDGEYQIEIVVPEQLIEVATMPMSVSLVADFPDIVEIDQSIQSLTILQFANDTGQRAVSSGQVIDLQNKQPYAVQFSITPAQSGDMGYGFGIYFVTNDAASVGGDYITLHTNFRGGYTSIWSYVTDSGDYQWADYYDSVILSGTIIVDVANKRMALYDSSAVLACEINWLQDFDVDAMEHVESKFLELVVLAGNMPVGAVIEVFKGLPYPLPAGYENAKQLGEV